jgi:hypothetical protein
MKPLMLFCALVIFCVISNITYDPYHPQMPQPDPKYVPIPNRPVDHYDWERGLWVYRDEVKKSTFKGQLPKRVKRDVSDLVDQLERGQHIDPNDNNEPEYANPF